MLESLPDHVMSRTDPDCKTCRGTGWVCENHPQKVWDYGAGVGCECGAAGMPCECTGCQGEH